MTVKVITAPLTDSLEKPYFIFLCWHFTITLCFSTVLTCHISYNVIFIQLSCWLIHRHGSFANKADGTGGLFWHGVCLRPAAWAKTWQKHASVCKWEEQLPIVFLGVARAHTSGRADGLFVLRSWTSKCPGGGITPRTIKTAWQWSLAGGNIFQFSKVPGGQTEQGRQHVLKNMAASPHKRRR